MQECSRCVRRAKAELGARDAGPMGRGAGGYMLARVMRGPLGGVRSDSGAWEGSRLLAGWRAARGPGPRRGEVQARGAGSEEAG